MGTIEDKPITSEELDYFDRGYTAGGNATANLLKPEFEELKAKNKKLTEALQKIINDPCFIHLLSSNQKISKEALKETD